MDKNTMTFNVLNKSLCRLYIYTSLYIKTTLGRNHLDNFVSFILFPSLYMHWHTNNISLNGYIICTYFFIFFHSCLMILLIIQFAVVILVYNVLIICFTVCVLEMFIWSIVKYCPLAKYSIDFRIINVNMWHFD